VLGEPLALGGGLAAGATDREELLQVRVPGEVTNDGADGVGVQGEAAGDARGGGPFEEVGLADLVVPLRGEGWAAEQGSQLFRAGHGSWVGNRQQEGRPRPARTGRSAEGIAEGEVGGQAGRRRKEPRRAGPAERSAME